MKTRANAVALFCASPCAAACAQGSRTAAVLAPPRAGYSFPQKQTLTYAVDWRVFPAGTAVIHFEAAGDRERIVASADTSGAINLIFHVADSFQSDFDREKGCTYDFDKQTVEGRRQINSTLHLDYANAQVDPRREEPGHRTDASMLSLPVHGCLTDLLTGVFYASSQPLALGHNFVIPVADAQRTVLVTMKVEGREEIKTTLGHLQDPSRAAHRRRRRGEEPRQHLDLVHRRRSPPAGADARAAFLGNDYVPAYRQRI